MSETITKVRYGLVGLLLFFCAAVNAQSISGNVKDANGEPVIGATIMEQGTQNGTVTDFDGNFTLKLQKGGNINVSYVGMKSQVIKTAGKSSVNITLEDDNTTLNDIVVVGYGTMKKSDLTGSVSSVNTEQLNAKGGADVMSNLQGATPGVNITQSSGRTNGGFNIEIRGKSSLNSSTTPLYVVDGVMCDDIDWLNPQDIEKIDVLKDASSTAIYGSRATAGVVMVTTKGGLSVKKNEKASISYDGYYGWTTTARMPEFMNGDQYYQYRFLKFLGASVANTSAQANPASPSYGFADAGTIGQCLIDQTGSGDYFMKDLRAAGNTYNWPDLITKNGSQQNHYIAVKGSTEKTSYHLGIGYNGQEGIYKNDSQKRINFKGSLDTQVNKVLSAGFSVNLARQKNTYANDKAIQGGYRMNPYMVPYFTEASAEQYNRLLNQGSTYQAGDLNPFPGNMYAMGTAETTKFQFTDTPNPLRLMDNTDKQRETWRVLGNLYLKFDFMKGLNFKTTFSPNYTYYRQGYYEGYEDKRFPGHTLDVTSSSPYMALPMTDDYTWSIAEYNTKRSFSWTWDNVINWNKTFKDIHSVNLMGLFSMQKSNTETLYWRGTNTKLVGADWWAMENLTQTNSGDDKSYTSYTENSMKSVAFRANYGFKDRYLVTATVRWDGSSRFADGNRWGSFPSFALAWRLTEEEFMKKYEWLSNLKLRVSYGVTGNCAGISDYATISSVTSSNIYPINGTYLTGYVPSRIVDKNLKWERSHEWNVGVDFGFWNNRLNGSIDWYSKTSKDLLYEVSLPLEAGVDAEGNAHTMITNIGSVRNTGVEIALNGTIIQTKDWNWTVGLNWSHNKNEVKEINGTSDRYIDSDNPQTKSLFVGRSINGVYAYKTAGIVSDQMMTVPDNPVAINAGLTPGTQMKSSDYYYKTYGWVEGTPIVVDANNDGAITVDDRQHYRGDPKWTGTLTSNLSWKNWDFSFSIYAKVGQYAYSTFMNEYVNWSDRGKSKLNVDYYIPAGTVIDCDGMNADGSYINPVFQEYTKYGEYPFPNYSQSNGMGATQYTGWTEAKNVSKASFAKVKNITLGYTFPKKWLTPWGCSHLRLYFTVTNPICWTGYKGFDPEWAGSSLKNDGPSTVTYQVGASIKF